MCVCVCVCVCVFTGCIVPVYRGMMSRMVSEDQQGTMNLSTASHSRGLQPPLSAGYEFSYMCLQGLWSFLESGERGWLVRLKVEAESTFSNSV